MGSSPVAPTPTSPKYASLADSGLEPKRRVTATHVFRLLIGALVVLFLVMWVRAVFGVFFRRPDLWSRKGRLGNRHARRPVRRATDLHDAPTG